MEHNYLQFNNQYYKEEEGLAVGALTSAILAETFIHLEHTVISNIFNENQIIDYYRYVDNILITYDAQKTNIEHTPNEFNSTHPKIKFTTENERQNEIDCLDITSSCCWMRHQIDTKDNIPPTEEAMERKPYGLRNLLEF
jgi:hypothetical protein